MLELIEEQIAKLKKLSCNIPRNGNEQIVSTKDCFIFYCLDVVQWHMGNPGLIYLFGKTYDNSSQCVNCSVAIKFCHQRLHFLPRKYFRDDPNEKVTCKDVFNDVCENVIPKLETEEVEFKKVTKKYAFDDNIPTEAAYLQIKCNVGNCWLKNQSGNTFSRMLGNQRQGFLETFLLERNIKGPCWLEIRNYITTRNSSTCKINIECHRIEDITCLKYDFIPPLILFGLEFKKSINKRTNKEEIVSVNCMIEIQNQLHDQSEILFIDHFCIFSNGITKHEMNQIQYLERYPHTNVFIVNEEERLLLSLISQISRYDPDIIYGHHMLGHQLDLLYSKILRYNITSCSKLSKLTFEKIPAPHFRTQLFAGRIVCDTKLLAEDMITSKTYSLHELSKDYLQLPHLNLTAEMLTACLRDAEKLPELIAIGIWDIVCVHKLMRKLNVLPLVFEITKLCGNTLNDTCKVFPLNRCEFLMLHAFHERNYILPPKFTKNEKDGPLTIKGGLVLEPEIGLHRNFVLAMDFQALYPSIIREFNVCFTTLKMNEDDEIVEVDGEGVLPQLVGDLIEHRKSILHEMEAKSNGSNDQQTADYIHYLKIKQGVVKRITNSIFGYLGCKSSRFMAEHLANYITAKGRQILLDTVAVLQNFESIKIIYGDTDSVMVETNLETYQEVVELSKKLREAINSKYRYVAIENAGIYKPFYILRKKKYAGIRYRSAQRTEEEIKGLDMIRRDWSGISSTVGKKVLREILSDTENVDVKIYNYLEDIRVDLEENHMKHDVESFAINKKLNKDPDKYSRKFIEHVNVALRYNATHADKMKEGDTVSYVICEDGSSRTPSERVYHVEEYLKSDTLKVDVDYYLSHQIYPVVKRVCFPLCNTVSGKELLIALKANLHRNRARRANGTATKKKKIEKPQPTLNPSTYFILKCHKCKQPKLVAYASLGVIKSCEANCEYEALSNFQEHLNSVLRALKFSYINKEKTFSETYEILVKIRITVEQTKRTNKQLSSYLAAIDAAREEFLKDVNCWNLSLNEIFVYPGNVTF